MGILEAMFAGAAEGGGAAAQKSLGMMQETAAKRGLADYQNELTMNRERALENLRATHASEGRKEEQGYRLEAQKEAFGQNKELSRIQHQYRLDEREQADRTALERLGIEHRNRLGEIGQASTLRRADADYIEKNTVKYMPQADGTIALVKDGKMQGLLKDDATGQPFQGQRNLSAQALQQLSDLRTEAQNISRQFTEQVKAASSEDEKRAAQSRMNEKLDAIQRQRNELYYPGKNLGWLNTSESPSRLAADLAVLKQSGAGPEKRARAVDLIRQALARNSGSEQYVREMKAYGLIPNADGNVEAWGSDTKPSKKTGSGETEPDKVKPGEKDTGPVAPFSTRGGLIRSAEDLAAARDKTMKLKAQQDQADSASAQAAFANLDFENLAAVDELQQSNLFKYLSRDQQTKIWKALNQ